MAALAAGQLQGHSPAAAAVREHLKMWGAYSSTPEDFSRPYPREAPETLASRLHAPIVVPPVELLGDLEEQLAELAEEDNTDKFEACAGLRLAALALARIESWSTVDEWDSVWARDPWTLEPVKFDVRHLEDSTATGELLDGHGLVPEMSAVSCGTETTHPR